jgi:RNA ligase (TIGR02306 family)
MSTHAVNVIRIPEVTKHPMADTLGMVAIGGYTCVIKLGSFSEGDLAVYIEPDYVVPENRDDFAFLGEHRRIKARKFRGVYSHGLLIAAEPDMREGDDVMERLGIIRYEPVLEGDADEVPHPSLSGLSAYDVENWRSRSKNEESTLRREWRDLFVPGEEVIVTEKLHGESGRFCWREGRMWISSKNRWKLLDSATSWARALRDNPWITSWCREHEDSVLFGEVHGHVKGFDYGVPKGKIGFRAFDRKILGVWQDARDFFEGTGGGPVREDHGQPHSDGLLTVPLIYRGKYDHALMETLAEGDSLIGKHMREGIVIKPAVERIDPEIGRVMLKLVSNRYLEKS